MGFKISSRFSKAAELINRLAIEKFSSFLLKIIKNLHIKNKNIFDNDSKIQLLEIFSLTIDELDLVLNSLCYTFEQAAFTSTGPEELYEILLSATFDDAHAKAITRTWSTEGAEYVALLRDSTLGFASLAGVDTHLHMVVGQSELTRQQEPVGIFELSIKNPQENSSKTDNESIEKLVLEFDHDELYNFFNQIERIQYQIDSLANN